MIISQEILPLPLIAIVDSNLLWTYAHQNKKLKKKKNSTAVKSMFSICKKLRGKGQ